MVGDFEKGLKEVVQAMELGQRQGFTNGIAKANHTIGNIYFEQSTSYAPKFPVIIAFSTSKGAV